MHSICHVVALAKVIIFATEKTVDNENGFEYDMSPRLSLIPLHISKHVKELD